MRKFLTALLAVVMVLPMVPAPAAQAQFIPERLAAGDPAFGGVAAVSLDAGILIKYIGESPAGGTVAVDAATGDITLETGTVASSTADLTVECPVSGALGGVIDVSNAACNTLGEVVDAINGSANWRAVIQDGLRSDSADNTLITMAETSAAVPKGIPLLKDTTVALNITQALVPVRNDIRVYLSGPGANAKLIENPFINRQSVLFRSTGLFTGTGADFFDVISVLPVNKTCTYTASAISCSAGETVTTYSEPGATTGVAFTFDHTRVGFYTGKDEKLLVRLRAATTYTAGRLFGQSIQFPHTFRKN